MTDNVTLPGSGAVIRSDDVGSGVQIQYVKLDVGGDGVSTPVSGVVPVGSTVVVCQDEFTRPADTTNYAANDCVADSTSAPTARTFTSAARILGGSGYVVGAMVLTDDVDASEWDNVALRLWLYNKTGFTLVNDNAAFNGPLYADRSLLVGYIDFPGFLREGGTPTALHTAIFDLRIPFVCDATVQNLYGQFEVKNAPSAVNNGQKFTTKLIIDQN
jgi:hypothetical protein